MSSVNGNPPSPDFESLRTEYEFANENRSSADAIAWEMTSIMWGAQTLLLGFALEAIGTAAAQPIIMALSLLGVGFTFFNRAVMHTRIIVSREMVNVLREIENKPYWTVKPQHRIDELYPPKRQTFWFETINLSLAVVWLLVGLRAFCLYFHFLTPTACGYAPGVR